MSQVCSPMVTSSSLLRATYPRQSLALIVVQVLAGWYTCPHEISRGACIYEMLVRTPKVIQKKKKPFIHLYFDNFKYLKKKLDFLETPSMFKGLDCYFKVNQSPNLIILNFFFLLNIFIFQNFLILFSNAYTY